MFFPQIDSIFKIGQWKVAAKFFSKILPSFLVSPHFQQGSKMHASGSKRTPQFTEVWLLSHAMAKNAYEPMCQLHVSMQHGEVRVDSERQDRK